MSIILSILLLCIVVAWLVTTGRSGKKLNSLFLKVPMGWHLAPQIWKREVALVYGDVIYCSETWDSRDCSVTWDSRGCSVTWDSRDCSVTWDSRDCSVTWDSRDCSGTWDSRDCSATWDSRDCSVTWDSRDCSVTWDTFQIVVQLKVFQVSNSNCLFFLSYMVQFSWCITVPQSVQG